MEEEIKKGVENLNLDEKELERLREVFEALFTKGKQLLEERESQKADSDEIKKTGKKYDPTRVGQGLKMAEGSVEEAESGHETADVVDSQETDLKTDLKTAGSAGETKLQKDDFMDSLLFVQSFLKATDTSGETKLWEYDSTGSSTFVQSDLKTADIDGETKFQKYDSMADSSTFVQSDLKTADFAGETKLQEDESMAASSTFLQSDLKTADIDGETKLQEDDSMASSSTFEQSVLKISGIAGKTSVSSSASTRFDTADDAVNSGNDVKNDH